MPPRQRQTRLTPAEGGAFHKPVGEPVAQLPGDLAAQGICPVCRASGPADALFRVPGFWDCVRFTLTHPAAHAGGVFQPHYVGFACIGCMRALKAHEDRDLMRAATKKLENMSDAELAKAGIRRTHQPIFDSDGMTSTPVVWQELHDGELVVVDARERPWWQRVALVVINPIDSRRWLCLNVGPRENAERRMHRVRRPVGMWANEPARDLARTDVCERLVGVQPAWVRDKEGWVLGWVKIREGVALLHGPSCPYPAAHGVVLAYGLNKTDERVVHAPASEVFVRLATEFCHPGVVTPT